MIISYLSHNKVIIKPGKITMLGTLNQVVYLDLIKGIKSNENDDRVRLFTDDYEVTTTKESIDWVGSVIDCDKISDKSTRKVIKTLINNLTNEEINQMQRVHQQINNLIQQKLFMTDLPLVVNFDYDNNKLFKYSEVKFDDSIQKNPIELLLTYIKIHAECNDDRTIVIINPSHFLSTEDLQELEDLCGETGISVLMIDYISYVEFNNYKSSMNYYIDEDFIDYY